MSSFRNAVKRKTHKERAQPESRKRFGLLEKHKDYVERARDYNKKKKRIQALQEKAAFRNPDEFYMKMQNMATKRGVHANLGEDSIDADTLKLFKTQDLSYVTLKKQSEQTKIGEGFAVGVCAARGVSNAPIGWRLRGRLHGRLRVVARACGALHAHRMSSVLTASRMRLGLSVARRALEEQSALRQRAGCRTQAKFAHALRGFGRRPRRV